MVVKSTVFKNEWEHIAWLHGTISAYAQEISPTSQRTIKRMETQIATLVLAPSSDAGFTNRSPKPDTLRAVKVTKDNIKQLAADLAKAGNDVEWESKTAFRANSALFAVGTWMVEVYDYVSGINIYRSASLADRQKYDLR